MAITSLLIFSLSLDLELYSVTSLYSIPVSSCILSLCPRRYTLMSVFVLRVVKEAGYTSSCRPFLSSI